VWCQRAMVYGTNVLPTPEYTDARQRMGELTEAHAAEGEDHATMQAAPSCQLQAPHEPSYSQPWSQPDRQTEPDRAVVGRTQIWLERQLEGPPSEFPCNAPAMDVVPTQLGLWD